jgi:hypothetical protein
MEAVKNIYRGPQPPGAITYFDGGDLYDLARNERAARTLEVVFGLYAGPPEPASRPTDSPYLTHQEAAAYCRVSPWTLYHHRPSLSGSCGISC